MRPGERWRWTVRLQRPHGSRNPHGFDAELWWWQQGVQATGYVRAQPAPQRLGLTSHAWLEQARDHVRQRLLAHAGPSRATGVVTALITGDQAAIAKADWQVFRTTGVAHLVSISGLHITMFAWLAVAVVGWMWRRSAGCVCTGRRPWRRPGLAWRWPWPMPCLAAGASPHSAPC